MNSMSRHVVTYTNDSLPSPWTCRPNVTLSRPSGTSALARRAASTPHRLPACCASAYACCTRTITPLPFADVQQTPGRRAFATQTGDQSLAVTLQFHIGLKSDLGAIRRRSWSIVAQLDRRQPQLHGRISTRQPDADAFADQTVVQQSLQIADALDRPTVEVEDQVAGSDPGSCRRRTVQQLHHFKGPRPTEVVREAGGQGPGPANDAEKRAPHPSVVGQCGQDSLGRRTDGDGQAEPDSGDRAVDSHHAAGKAGQ